MKTIFTTFALVVITTIAFGQGLSLKSYIEQTEVGPKVGSALGFNTKSGIEIGGFFQKAVDGMLTEESTPWNCEKEFYGAYFTYPVVSGQFFDLGFNVRTGVSNGENFTITPSLLTSVSPIKQVKVGAGLGVRAMRPTVQGVITIRLNAGSKGGVLASN
ncbi:hypothetical protein [Marinoscillum pacificum]|uniref:hypothetical protein n=1 Tax=Marinoscillum pacificum TaxID=392723 RepID=UPI0021588C0A|nr:hypothetical protein [Marinoscillum pacificum]